jgi:hypothetical protein
MKRLVLTLIIIVGLATPALALDRNLFFFAGSGDGGGGGGLNNTSSWSIATGLAYGENQTITMTGLVNSDSFDDSSLDPMWNTSVFGSGAVTETTHLVINAPAGTDAAILCYDHDLTRTNNYRFRVTGQSTGAGTDTNYTVLVDNASSPVVTTSGAFLTNVRLFSFPASGDPYAALTYTSGHVLQYFNPTLVGFWQAGAVSAQTDINKDEVWIFELENDGTTVSQSVIHPTTGVRYAYTYRAWSAMQAETNQIWACMGVPFTDTNSGAFIITNFEHYGDYFTTSPVATMGQITVGASITHLGIFENNNAGCTITWRYDIGAGWVAPGSGTLSELETALVGTAPATLNLEAAFNSNGTANCTLSLDGSAITN